MNKNKLLGISIFPQTKSNILYKIKKYIKDRSKKTNFFHIVSLNPENLVLAQENHDFKKALNEAQIKIIDGVGVILAGKILKIAVGERVPGVDLMQELLYLANKIRLRVVFIGGKGKLAETLANCYQKKFPQAKFLGIEGIKNIRTSDKQLIEKEEKIIFSIVSSFKPHLVFVAFGSPNQELWLERHKNKFKGSVVMGVGGAFDFLGGKVWRAPKIWQKIGLEWLFRLLIQPWRLKRQRRLIKFIFLVLKELLLKVNNQPHQLK